VKFLAIFANNLDEFFQVRVAGLRQQVAASAFAARPTAGRPRSSWPPSGRASRPWSTSRAGSVRPDPGQAGRAEIRIVDYASVPEHHARLRERFIDEVFPVLTPLAVDPGHPFPYISTLSLSIAVGLRDPETGERRFARVKVPPVLPRLMELDRPRSCCSTRSSNNLDPCSPAWRSSRPTSSG
jgi:polyphosphate kinase